MKSTRSLLKAGMLGVFILSGTALHVAAQDFEGIIYYEMPEMEQNGIGNLAYMIKDSKIRVEFGEGVQKNAMLLLPEKSKMVIIMAQMKAYMTMDQSPDKRTNESEQDFTLEKTGNIKTIASHSCEVWIMTQEENRFELCMAKGLGRFMMPESPMASSRNVPQWAKEAMSEGVMPLEVVMISGDQPKIQMKATRIEKKALDSSLFEIPAGYRDMSSMMKQMMNRSQN